MKQEVGKSLRYFLPCMLVILAGSVFAADFVVCNNSDDHVRRYTETGELIWETPTGFGLQLGLRIGPDGKVYVGGWTSDVIGVFDPETGVKEGNILSGTIDRVARFCFGPDVDGDGIKDIYTAEGAGGMVRSWTSSSGYMSVGSYDASGVTADGAWALDFGPDVTGDGVGELYIRDNVDDVYVANGVTGELEYSFQCPGVVNAVELTCGSDGRVYIADSGGKTMVSYLPDGTGEQIHTHEDLSVGTNGGPVDMAEAEPGVWYLANKISSSNGTVMILSNNFTASSGVLVDGDNFTGIDVFYEGARGGAHSPDPTGSLVDSTAVSSISWQGPLTQSDPNGDPNIVSVDGYDVYWSTDPNYLTDEPVSVKQPGESYTPTSPAIGFNTTYFWRVDTYVTWDSNEFTGTESLESIVQGVEWQFTTAPEYLSPIMTIDNVITTTDIGSADLSATIIGNSDPMNAPVFTLATDDIEFPAGSDAVLTNTTVDNQNPTATLTTTTAGTYKIQLEVSDGTTSLETVAEVKVYDDACQAQKDAGGWTANEFDLDGNCLVDLLDFAAIAAEWLDDTSMDAQASYTGPTGIVPQDIFDIRIEAEWVDPNDPNACSDGPISDNVGIRIQEQPNASGGQATGYASATAWIEYTVDVPVSAVGVAVDVYAAHALSGTGTVTLSFGTGEEGEADIYGTITLPGTNGWTNFTSGAKLGQVTFTAAGPQIVRTSYGGGLNLDWFSFDF